MASERYEADWGSLPLPLLCRIFRTLLEQNDTVDTIVYCYTNLVTVNKHWSAAGKITPLCFHLTDQQKHLSEAALNWLTQQTLEVIIIDRGQAAHHEDLLIHLDASTNFLLGRPFITALLTQESTQRNSKDTLISLVNIPARTVPFLSPFSYLKQVTLFNPSLVDRRELIDVAALSSLPRLSCLTVAGYFSDQVDWSALPTTLKHLSISKFTDPQADFPAVTGTNGVMGWPGLFRISTLSKLEYLSLKAANLIVDWEDIVNRCDEIHLSAEQIKLIVGGDKDGGGDIHSIQVPVIERFAHLVATAQRTEIAVLTFHVLGLFHKKSDVPVTHVFTNTEGNVRVDDMVTILREVTLSTWDLDPVMDMPPNFVNDVDAGAECYVLTLDKQDGPEPRSYHFTTPISDEEIRQMCIHPAWRLAWCPDPRTEEILQNEDFVRANAHTLVRLSRCTLPQDVDLRPFTSLRSLQGTIKGNHAPMLLPSGLTSIEFETPLQPSHADLNEPGWLPRKYRYNATGLSSLTKLKDLSLTGWLRHDLTAMPTSVVSLRLVNPKRPPINAGGGFFIFNPEFQLGPESLRLPPHLAPSDPRKLSTRGVTNSLALLVGSLLGVAPGRMAWSDDENETQVAAAAPAAAFAGNSGGGGNEQRGGGEETSEIINHMAIDSVSPLPAGPSQVGGEAAQQGQEQNHVGRRRRRKRRHVPDGVDDAIPLPEHEDAIFFSLYEDEDEDDLLASGEHAAGGAHSCDDPLCPVHSGKPHLQLLFNDTRDTVIVDLLFLVSTQFPMISITIDPPARLGDDGQPRGMSLSLNVGPSWSIFLKALESSKVEVLEFNHHMQKVTFTKDPPNEVQYHRLWQGLKEMEKKLGRVFMFRTWDGVTSQDGLHEQGECFALVRRESLVVKPVEGGVGV